MRNLFLLFLTLLFTAGCSAVSPGYLSSRPDASTLTQGKTTLEDIHNSFGDPASSQKRLNDSVIYKYYYNTPSATVDKSKMLKGDYDGGCKDCGQIVAIFKWKEKTPLQDFVLTGLAVSDPTLTAQTNAAYTFLQQEQFTQAYQILLKVAAQNYLPAEQVLGIMYINGDGIGQDYKKAFYWFSRASAAQYPPALYELGRMYKNGEGVTQDLNKAIDLFEESGNFGYKLAIKKLIKLYSSVGNLDKADQWIQKYQALP